MSVVLSQPDYLVEMQTQRGELVAEARRLDDLARGERREFTEIEVRQFDEIMATVTDLDRRIDREQTLRGLERASQQSIRPAVRPTHGDDGEAGAGFGEASRRFQSLSEFLTAVRNFYDRPGHPLDRRLEWRAGLGMNEGSPSDGGFLVQQDFVGGIWRRMYETGQVLSRCRRIGISSNSNGLKLPAIDETSRATGSRYGGVQAYWLAEGGPKTGSRPRLREIDLTLWKVAALVYVTDELLADASALETYVNEAVGGELIFQVENAIFRGTGAGQPLGILNSAALVTQAAESGPQTADTFNVANAAKMYGRLWSESMLRAVWYLNQDVYQQILQLASSNTLAFIEPGRMSDAPRGALLGRPLVPIEYASTLGDVGDIVLADMSQYLVAEKGGIQAASSIHVQFLTDETAFRFVYRVDGEPLWNSSLTPFQGSNTLSPFVALAAR